MRTLKQVQNWANRFGVCVQRDSREYKVWTSGAMTDVSYSLEDAIQAVHEFIAQENLHVKLSRNDILERTLIGPTGTYPPDRIYVISVDEKWIHVNHIGEITVPDTEYVKNRVDSIVWISPISFLCQGHVYKWLNIPHKISRISGYTVSFR